MTRHSALSSFRLRSTARWLIATGLTGTAQMLRLASDAAGTVAKQLRVSMPPSEEDTEGTPEGSGADSASAEHATVSTPLASAPEPSSPFPHDAPSRRRGPLSTPLTEPVNVPSSEAPAPDEFPPDEAPTLDGTGVAALTEPTPAPGEGSSSESTELQTPTEPVADVPQRSRKPDSDIADLASKPARTVISEIATLSTEELRWLHEYEQAHKNRKTVLGAIAEAGADHAT